MSRWLISVPIWGDAYVAKFAAALPALRLAAARVGGKKLIIAHTDKPGEVEQMSDTLPIEARPISVSGDGYYVTMSGAFREVMAMARPGDIVVHMVADAVISANALAACDRAFRRGKKIVAACPVRVFDDSGPFPFEDSRELLKHAWHNRHFITRDSTWPGGDIDGGGHELCRIYFDDGENVVARTWLPHPLAFLADGRPVTFGNSPDMDLVANFNTDEIHLVTDPDELAYVALESRSRTLSPEPPISERLGHERLSLDVHRWLLSHRVCIRGRNVDLGDEAVVAPLIKGAQS